MSWHHYIDHRFPNARLSKLGATPAAQVSDKQIPPSTKKALLKLSHISTPLPTFWQFSDCQASSISWNKTSVERRQLKTVLAGSPSSRKLTTNMPERLCSTTYRKKFKTLWSPEKRSSSSSEDITPSMFCRHMSRKSGETTNAHNIMHIALADAAATAPLTGSLEKGGSTLQRKFTGKTFGN